MINEDMMKYIFNALDQHKKGYIVENDFVGLFGGYNWKAENIKEFKDYIKVKFNSAEAAFRFMSEYKNKKIDYERFKQVIKELFSNRFQPSDC